MLLGFCLAAESGGYSLLRCSFSLRWLLLCRPGSRTGGLQWLQHVGSGLAAPGLSSTGSVAVVHRLSCSTMWDLPRPGVKPVSPALAGGFVTTEPLGNPCVISFSKHKQTLNFKHESSLSPQPGPLVGTNLPWTLALLTSLLLSTSDLL